MPRTTTTLHTYDSHFSRTTWASRYQKGKTSLDLNEARDNGAVGCSGISWTISKQSAPRSRQITTPTPHHSIFTGRALFLMPKQQCKSNEGFSVTSVNYGINSNIRARGRFLYRFYLVYYLINWKFCTNRSSDAFRLKVCIPTHSLIWQRLWKCGKHKQMPHKTQGWKMQKESPHVAEALLRFSLQAKRHMPLLRFVPHFPFLVFSIPARSSCCIFLIPISVNHKCLQCFDAVGWAAGRASGL